MSRETSQGNNVGLGEGPSRRRLWFNMTLYDQLGAITGASQNAFPAFPVPYLLLTPIEGDLATSGERSLLTRSSSKRWYSQRSADVSDCFVGGVSLAASVNACVRACAPTTAVFMRVAIVSRSSHRQRLVSGH